MPAAVNRHARRRFGPSNAPDGSPAAWLMPSPAAFAQVKEPAQASVAASSASMGRLDSCACRGSWSLCVLGCSRMSIHSHKAVGAGVKPAPTYGPSDVVRRNRESIHDGASASQGRTQVDSVLICRARALQS
jgi:hypothetical protein